METKTNKWKIIHLKVEKQHQLIAVDFKLPNDIQYCRAILLSVREFLNTPSSSVMRMGEISLMFNAKQKHLLQFTSEYHKDLSDKKEPLRLDCEMKANQNITGFYFDYASSLDDKGIFLPYTLSIYLDCISKS